MNNVTKLFGVFLLFSFFAAPVSLFAANSDSDLPADGAGGDDIPSLLIKGSSYLTKKEMKKLLKLGRGSVSGAASAYKDYGAITSLSKDLNDKLVTPIKDGYSTGGLSGAAQTKEGQMLLGFAALAGAYKLALSGLDDDSSDESCSEEEMEAVVEASFNSDIQEFAVDLTIEYDGVIAGLDAYLKRAISNKELLFNKSVLGEPANANDLKVFAELVKKLKSNKKLCKKYNELLAQHNQLKDQKRRQAAAARLGIATN